MTFNVTIRGLSEIGYRKLKSRAAEEGKNIGEAVNEAVDLWLSRKKNNKGKAWLEVLKNPSDFGVVTKESDVDQYVYR